MVNPTVISTFAGCGGSSLGYKWAKFNELLAIEWENNAVETFKINFPDIPIWQKDIKECIGEDILKFCKIKKGELDILDGSPPCQGFSTAGKRKVKDNRNDLFKEFIRLINELSPKVFIIENVSGIVKGKMKGKFIEIITLLKSLNYEVKTKLMNSMYYEVPQSRQRIIFIGIRKDLNKEPTYPEPLKEIITVKKAWNGLINKQERLYPEGKLKSIVSWIKQGEQGSKYHPQKHYFNTIRICYNKPSPTLLKTINKKMTMALHPTIDASISINEMKRLFTFPDTFQFIGKFEEQWGRMGNCVPPKLIYHIANHIKKTILN